MDSLQLLPQKPSIPNFNLPGRYANDIWNITTWDYYTDSDDKSKEAFHNKGFAVENFIDFKMCSNQYIREEIKYYLYLLIEIRKVNLYSFGTYFNFIKAIIRYSNEYLNKCYSLVEVDIDDYTDFICNRDIRKKIPVINAGKRIRAKNMKWYQETSTSKYIKTLSNIIDVVNDFFDNRSLYEKDTWALSKLPFHINNNLTNTTRSITFNIAQPLMKEAVKKYTWNRFNSVSVSSIKADSLNLKKFCDWVYKKHPNIKSFADINRDIINEYVVYLRTEANISSAVLARRIGSLSMFLDFCRYKRIPNTPRINLIDESTRRVKVKLESEQPPYTDNEMKQIMANINKLENIQMARMVYCLGEIACRPSELCLLTPGCLKRDDDKYSLTIQTTKNTNIYSIPISDTVGMILEAAYEDSQKIFGKHVVYIFASSHNEFITTASLDYYLKKLSIENNIVDDAGNILHITFHRFRTTRASKYLQQGMDVDIISLLLGHKVKHTLQHYAKASNKDIFIALKPLMDKYELMIENMGNMSSMKDISTDTIPLPNGRCAKSASTGICDHANHCLSCSMFIPKPEFCLGYERQLEEVEKALDLAERNNNERLIEYNTNLKKQLMNILEKCSQEVTNEKI